MSRTKRNEKSTLGNSTPSFGNERRVFNTMAMAPKSRPGKMPQTNWLRTFMNIKNRKKNDQVLPLNMVKQVCRFRMFSVYLYPIMPMWPPPVTCRGSCSPSVGLSPHPERTSERWLRRDKARHVLPPGKKRPPRDHRCPKYQASIRTAQVHLNLWMLINMLMFTAVTAKRKSDHGRFPADQGSVSAKCENSRRPSGSFRSRSRDNLCSC